MFPDNEVESESETDDELDELDGDDELVVVDESARILRFLTRVDKSVE